MRLDELTVRELLTSIAAKTPTPGGGAVASLTAALAAALTQMVINFSVGKKSLAAHDALHLDALKSLGELSSLALDLAEQDARAYGRLNELWKLDRNDERRQREFPAAVSAAIDAPQQVVNLTIKMLEVMHSLLGTTNPMLKSDLAVGAILAEAAARAAAWNVRINLPLLHSSQRQRSEADIASNLDRVHAVARAIEESCLSRSAGG